ncbi:MAG: class I SAM-dependent methyltransferase [Dongiaceae bacterium]
MNDESRFRSAAPFYARFRPPYPGALIGQIVARCGLDGSGRLLDLGCGPGPLAIALAPHVGTVVAMDPEPEMLAEAEIAAAAAGVRLQLVRGGSRDLAGAPGRFRLVTMGRSFHWMDRDATLAALDRLVLPDGWIAVLGERPVDGAPGWRAAWERVGRKWSGPAWAPRDRRRAPDWEPHDAVLARSAFAAIERLSVRELRTTPLDAIVGRAYSMSSTSPAALGDNRAAFESELREALAPFVRGGGVPEESCFEALLARRPG